MKTKKKMDVNKASASRDLRVEPEIAFGFVENFITEGSKSLGENEISKRYKYFRERYVTNVTSK